MQIQGQLRRVILMAGLCGLAFNGVKAQQIQVSGANRTIAITTTEQAERRADIAIVHIGYQLYAPTSAQVNQEAGSSSKAITAALAGAGVPKDAVESQSQSTGPVQDFQVNQFPPEERQQRKFQAAQEWAVRVSTDTAAKVLAAAVDAGANQSGNIEWSVADESALSAEAAGKALQHARAIAEQMAGGLGAKLGPLVYASNQAEQLSVLPLNARAMQGMGKLSSQMNELQPLNLSAPMVRRSATVSAVFSIQ